MTEHLLFVFLPTFVFLVLVIESFGIFFPSIYFSNDYLRIANNTNDIIGVFCGQKIGNWVRVTGNFTEITFHSDSIVQRTGYELFFSYSGYPGKSCFLPSNTLVL